MLPAPQRRPRRGSVAIYALTALPVLLIVFAGVVRVAFTRLDKTDLQTACDAASLAGVKALADSDALLCGDPRALPAALSHSRAAAAYAAAQNAVRGRPVAVKPEDVEFGRIAPGGPFEPVNEGDCSALRQVNAVRVTAAVLVGKNREPLVVRSVALLDFNVVGVQPVTDRPVPLMPVGVQFHPARPHPRSLGAQPFCDEFRPRQPGEGNGWARGRDGIGEVAVILGAPRPGDRGASAWFLQLGGGNLPGQIANGVTAADLSAWPAGFRLDPQNALTAPASAQPQAMDSAAFNRTVAALNLLRDEGSPRVWPTGRAAAGNKVEVTGFFGARVAAVEPDFTARRVRLVLQSTVFATPTAMTAAPGGSPLPPPFNMTVCRPRLAE